MIGILNVIGVILILSFLVVIHELGHFWAAKKNGIKVHEFGIGFPPKLFKFKKGETEYSVNLIPFGGYVKLHGEDATDPKVLKDKHSFASKTPWQKVEVLVAGVLMNFLVFWVLMSIAIFNGVDPVVTNQEQFRAVFADGYYKMRPEVLVQESKDSRVKQGDVLTSLNGKPVQDIEMVANLVRGDFNDIESIGITTKQGEVNITDVESIQNSITFYAITSVPTLEVVNVNSTGYLSNILKKGDIVYAVNDKPVFESLEFVEMLKLSAASPESTLGVIRDSVAQEILLPVYKSNYIIDEVTVDSPAEKSGILKGDKIIAVDGLLVGSTENLAKIVKDKGLEKVVYTVLRGDQELDLVVEPNEEGLIGVYLTSSLNLTDFGVDLVSSYKIGSVIEVKKLTASWYKAPVVALDEGVKIAKATAEGFIRTVYGVISSLKVSEEVGGPVQVAKLSYQFVQKGGVDLINFIALISLSLAVINILPFPALDGGRLLFVIIEAFRGKPIDPRYEGVIHGLGFMLLMALILVVTFYDIIRL